MFTHTPVVNGTIGAPQKSFFFAGNRLLIRIIDGGVELPELNAEAIASGDEAQLPGVGRVEISRNLVLGSLDGALCRVVELRLLEETRSAEAKDVFQGPDQSADGLVFAGLRSLMGRLEEELLKVAGVASQVLDWDRNHQYCGRCGSLTVASETERSRTCPSCSLTAYPRISPAIIVAVTRNDRILLGHNRRHRAGRIFSVLAGFVEPGESLEECVRREVMEEVGIEISGVRYFASQPWPFPDSLMVAFTAEYLSGEISVDGSEIIEADWFDKDHLPGIPPRGTVARRLIDWFVTTQGGPVSAG